MVCFLTNYLSSIEASYSCNFQGTIQFPGGHLEVGESWFACAERETLEETGLLVRAKKLLATTNDVFDEEKKHYITLFILCERTDDQEPAVSDAGLCFAQSETNT